MRSKSNSLESFEEHEYLHLAGPAIEVRVALHGCVHHCSYVHRGSHTHHQAEVSISIEELLSLELAAEVHVVSLIDQINIVSE